MLSSGASNVDIAEVQQPLLPPYMPLLSQFIVLFDI